MMFEKTRTVRRPSGEPTFHIFYQMLAGVDSVLRFDIVSPLVFLFSLHRENYSLVAGKS